jgi:hypothetical protein
MPLEPDNDMIAVRVRAREQSAKFATDAGPAALLRAQQTLHEYAGRVEVTIALDTIVRLCGATWLADPFLPLRKDRAEVAKEVDRLLWVAEQNMGEPR